MTALNNLWIKGAFLALMIAAGGYLFVEWTINRQELGINTFFNETDAMTIRLSTIYENEDSGREPCDQTAWFAPYVHQSSVAR